MTIYKIISRIFHSIKQDNLILKKQYWVFRDKKGGPTWAARENHAFIKALTNGVIAEADHRAVLVNRPGINRSIIIQNTTSTGDQKVGGRSGRNSI